MFMFGIGRSPQDPFLSNPFGEPTYMVHVIFALLDLHQKMIMLEALEFMVIPHVGNITPPWSSYPFKSIRGFQVEVL